MASTKKRVFGVHLSKVMKRTEESNIPTIVRVIHGYFLKNPEALKQEGLFQSSGLKKYSKTLKEMKRIANTDISKLDLTEERFNHGPLVSCLLMLYLKELPDPLIPYVFYHDFIEVARQYAKADYDEFVAAVATVISRPPGLPEYNSLLLGFLVLFLARVCSHEEDNQMSSDDLAREFAPLVLRQRPTPLSPTSQGMVQHPISPRKRMASEEIITPEHVELKVALMKLFIDRLQDIFANHNIIKAGSWAVKKNASQDVLAATKAAKSSLVNLKGDLKPIKKSLEDEEDVEKLLALGRKLRRVKQALCGLGNRQMVLSTQSAVVSVQGKRSTMEDTCRVIEDLFSTGVAFPGDCEWDNFSYYGVYDGHAGSEVAEFLEPSMHTYVLENPCFLNCQVERAIELGFQECDAVIRDHKEWKSGSTVALALLLHHELFVANCGDSEVVLGRERKTRMGAYRAIPLTRKHTLKDPLEVERIKKLGGDLYRNRLFGVLAVSRAMGDSAYKKPVSAEDYVSSAPFVTSFTLTEEDHFLILSCDGLWEKLGYQTAIDFVGEELIAKNRDLEAVTKELVDLAIDHGSQDNITVILVRLRWRYGAEYE